MITINKNNYLPFAILSNVLWALIIVITVELKKIDIEHHQILFSMFSISTIALFFVSLNYKNEIKEKFNHKQIKIFFYLILISTISFFLYRYALYYGLQNSNAFVVNSLNYTWIIFMLLISMLMGNTKEKLDFYTKYIYVIGLIGVFFVFDLFKNNNEIDVIYILMVGAAFLTALSANIIIKIKETIIDNLSFIHFLTFLILTIGYIIFSLIEDINILPNSIEDFIYLSLFSLLFLVAKLLWTKTYAIGNKVTVSFLGYIIPILSNGIFIIYYDYELSISIVIGSILILISGILLNKTIKKKIILLFKQYIYKI